MFLFVKCAWHCMIKGFVFCARTQFARLRHSSFFSGVCFCLLARIVARFANLLHSIELVVNVSGSIFPAVSPNYPPFLSKLFGKHRRAPFCRPAQLAAMLTRASARNRRVSRWSGLVRVSLLFDDCPTTAHGDGLHDCSHDCSVP